MSNQNAFIAAIDSRIAFESNEKKTACASSIALLQKTRAYFAQDAVASFASEAKLDASFIMQRENASSLFCMKAIARCIEYVQFALNGSSHIKTDNARNVLETAIALDKAKMRMTRDDAQASCTSANDKSVSVAKEKAKLVVRRDTIIEASKRQAAMSLKALVALGVIRETAKNEYSLNRDSLLTQRILKRCAK